MGVVWRVLIVDDLQAADVAEIIQGNKVASNPDSIVCVECGNFSDAVTRLQTERFDIVILDLKDDASADQENLAGEVVFNELKKHRFLPVIFHTGYAEKVADLASAYVKVVTRGDDPKLLRNAVEEILATKLPRLFRHIEEEQKKFMWESAEKIWVEDLEKGSASDIVYLLARRLSNVLSSDAVRSFLGGDGGGDVPQIDKIHAVELYVYPPISRDLIFGDIFEKTNGSDRDYFVVLTPSCDLARNMKNADFVLLSKCKRLMDTEAAKKIVEDFGNKVESSKNSIIALKEYIVDNSNPKDRYKYLPGTSFLPDLLVDFQSIRSVTPSDLQSDANLYSRVASLDSPFAEALQAKMARYLGRIGVPDIDSDLAVSRFKMIAAKVPAKAQ